MGDSRPLSGRAGLAGGRNSPAGSLASVEAFAAHALQNVNTPFVTSGTSRKDVDVSPRPVLHDEIGLCDRPRLDQETGSRHAAGTFARD
jgi:hypothetical protein